MGTYANDFAAKVGQIIRTAAADEMAAHRMKDERPTLERVTHRVAYDPIKEEYQRIP